MDINKLKSGKIKIVKKKRKKTINNLLRKFVKDGNKNEKTSKNK
ncbi:hypothetical protein [Halarcobacter sp.]